MIKTLLHLFLIFLVSIPVYSQKKGIKDYHPPLGIPLILSANFGELRPNHFHTGIDFKTQGKTGFNIYSIDEGHVSRIKVSPYGYGKVIYIDHPNGITSVYAHCSEFKGGIDSLVKRSQIREKNFEVEIFPKKNQISVKKGEIIAISGNTGGSTAPHLHFELRETKTEHALNPLVYGFEIQDDRAPEIRGLKVYGITNKGYVFPGKEMKKTINKGTNAYYLPENKLIVPSSYLSLSGGLGLSFDVIDRLSGANNQCGLYGSYLIVNGDTIFGQKTDRIPFESSRYVNSHKDYQEYAKSKAKFHKCFRTAENDLPIYVNSSIGLIKTKPGETLKVHYVAYDPIGNKSEVQFDLVVAEGEINPKNSIEEDLSYLKPDFPMKVAYKNTEVEFGLATVYEPIKIDDTKIQSRIGDADIPVHNAYLIHLKLDEKQDGKHYIEMITAKGNKKALLVNYESGQISCESKFFGSYKIKKDTIAPVVQAYNFKNTSTALSANTLQWKIYDKGTGIRDYNLYIDGEWKLLEYEYKTGLVTYQREANMNGDKEIIVRVTDECGNSTDWKKNIRLQ